MKQAFVKGVQRILPDYAATMVRGVYRKTQGRLVSARYGNPSKHLRVIVVSGASGKTTTACYINEILKEARFKTALLTTILTEIDGTRRPCAVPASATTAARVQRFFRDARRANVDYVVLEVPSQALERSLNSVPIEAVVLTNTAQYSQSTTQDTVATEAGLLRLRPRFAVLNRDDACYEQADQLTASEQKMTYGTHSEAEARIMRVKLYRKGTEADVVLDHQTHLELATHLPGEFNVLNMTAAVTLAYLLGVKLQDIQEGVANLEAVPGRFERAVEGLPYDVIVDYAHTPDALEKLLATARDIARGRVLLVFGACGDRDRSKRPIMGEIAARGADRIFLTDEESYNEDPEEIRAMLREGIERAGGAAKTTEIADRRQAIERALGAAKKGDMVLITGMGHEQYRIVNGQRLPWNDTEVVREIAGR